MRPGPGDPRRPGSESAVRAAVIRFTVFGALAAVILIAGTIVPADRIASHRALEDGQARGAGIANGIAAPLVDADVRQYRPGASDRLDEVIGNRMEAGYLRRVKIWNRLGRVIWSDQDELIGRSFQLPDEVDRLFGTRDTVAEVSDLDRAENVGEQPGDQLLEVYAGAFDAEGEPIVVETYLTTEQMKTDAQVILWSFVPLVAGALVLFLLVVLPLAVSLGRRVERAQLDRSRMMRHAVVASEQERRRIAADLHDGVIQDLAGLAYALPSAHRELHADGDLPSARSTLARATALLQRDVLLLRGLMTDIYPPDLDGAALGDAVHQLVHSEAFRAGLHAEVVIEDPTAIPTDAGRLAYRIIREGIRNVVSHAHAGRVWVELRRDADEVTVRVVDDGRGPDPDSADKQGHLGLRLLADAVHDFAGTLDVRAGTPAEPSWWPPSRRC